MKLSDKINQIKIFQLGGQTELDLGPISDSEYDLYFNLEGSGLSKAINRRLIVRSPHTALLALVATTKEQVCFKCRKHYTNCYCGGSAGLIRDSLAW